MLIQLTTFHHNRIYKNNPHGQPVWVNPSLIAYLAPSKVSIIATEEHNRAPLMRPTEPFTCITFAAMGHEDDLSIRVCETPEQILERIGQ